MERRAKTPRHYSTYRGYRRNESDLSRRKPAEGRAWLGVDSVIHNKDYPILIKTTSDRGETHYMEYEKLIAKQVRNKDISSIKED